MPSKLSSGEVVHPLDEEVELREEVLDVMWLAILKVLRWPKSPRHTGSSRVLPGTSSDAEDILSRAFWDLRAVDPEGVRKWKALAVTIAQRRAKDALAKSQAGLRETERRARLYLISGDQPANPSLPAAGTVLENVVDPHGDPEGVVVALEEVGRVLALARSLAPDRDAEIFLRVHCGETRREVGQDYGISGQRVGQIYDRVLTQLEEHEDYPYRPNQGEDE